MDKLAEKFIKNHKQPLVKLEIDGLKLSTSSNSQEEKNRVENALSTLKTALCVDRVERRCARSKCKWLNDENLAQVVHVVGALLQNYGYQNKNGVFLRPEEALFLLETNKVELFWNEVPMSIQQAYAVILKDGDALNNYRTYRTLKLLGYKLSRNERTQKRELVEKQDSESKRACLETPPGDSGSGNVESNIVQDAPVQIQNTEIAEWNYKVRFPESTKKDDIAFFLQINKTDLLNECLKIGNHQPVITAITSPDDVAFYRFSSVDLPVL